MPFRSARPHPMALLGCVLGLFGGCEPFADDQEFDREEVLVYRRFSLADPPAKSSEELRVMAWNIKYAAGRLPFWFDCWGDTVQLTREQVESNLDALAGLINEMQPDVLMVEEIETNSRRSAYVDMVRGLLERTSLNHAAYFETWDSRYVPSEGVGRINLGNAIFSRYPITFAERIRQEDRTDLDPLTKTFYLHRAVGRAEIEVVPGKRLATYVVHTEAYDRDGTKQRQIKQIHTLLSGEVLPFVVGGDFNELPPTAVKREGFLDERTRPVCDDDFAQPPYTPEVMQPFYDDLLPWIPLDRYGLTEQQQRRFYSHSVLGPDETNEAGQPGDWNRTLDYLFARKSDAWTAGSTDVLQQRGQRVGGDDGIGPVLQSDVLRLSDHAPVFGIWEVRR